MPTAPLGRLPKTESPEEFERMVLDCAQKHYNQDMSLWGRKGQGQDGIDIISEDNQIVIQCKNYFKPGDILSLVKNDYKNAASISGNNFKKFVAVTSLDRDAKLQRAFINIARQKNSAGEPIELVVWFWDSIEKTILPDRRLLGKYYPDFTLRTAWNAKSILSIVDSPALSMIRTQFDKDLIYFPQKDINDINATVSQLNDKQQGAAWIMGDPGSGKSVLMYQVGLNFIKSNSKREAFYYSCQEHVHREKLEEDLYYYNDEYPNDDKLLIIDDVHLAKNVADYIYYIWKHNERFRQWSLLFVGRRESDRDAFEFMSELSATRVNIIFNSHNSQSNNKSKRKNALSEQYASEKMMGIIKKFVAGANTDYKLPEDPDDLNELYKNIFGKTDNNLINLQYYLEAWKELTYDNPKADLTQISKADIYRHIYHREFERFSPLEREAIIRYAAIYQFEVPFEVAIDDYAIIQQLRVEHIVSRERKYYSFYHSKYAELLLEAYCECDDYFDLKYFDKWDMTCECVRGYIDSYSKNRGRTYPNGMFEILDAISVKRNSRLTQSVGGGNTLFQVIIDSDNIRKQIYSYYYNSCVDTREILRLVNLIKQYVPKYIPEIESALVYKDDRLWLKEKILESENGFLAFVDFVNTYPELYSLFSGNEILRLAETSKSAALKKVFEFKDTTKKYDIIKLIPLDDWKVYFQESNIDRMREILQRGTTTISSSAKEKRRQNRDVTVSVRNEQDIDFVAELLHSISKEDIIEKINVDPLRQLSATLSVIKLLDESLAKEILDSYSDDECSEWIGEYVSQHDETHNLQLAADFINNISNIDFDRAKHLLDEIDNQQILSAMSDYSFVRFVDSLTKFKKIDPQKTQNILFLADEKYLLSKAEVENENKFWDGMAKLESVGLDTADYVFVTCKNHVSKQFREGDLSNILSHSEQLMRFDKDTVSEVLENQSNYILDMFVELNDIRDTARFIRLYGKFSDNETNKEILEHAMAFVDSNFEDRYFNKGKEWVKSVIGLIRACGQNGYKLKSLSETGMKEKMRAILFQDSHIGNFDYYVSVLEFHCPEFASELRDEYELKYSDG